ncbi:hypothetical protein [Halomonas urumqiensis]|uniref:Uncharacterized protein n=1 Tax=Halomonas urumqiensis TaxID=1684789 RepID=A0A2N7UKD7_9GAMM|nr:hypothetical protein [Halomonas urumqiensis]PMR80908.1 hypothetical protein C1H70_07595 [Halomonas urumqiensis]PTB02866.1 hypothetical protein C6V82_09595 [Halomonas urumqiensis]GHE21387.1 hypothetical protein GCM10017767_19080 [Halomonas urumqiensis]
MSYRINTALNGLNPTLQICDATTGSVRVAWEYPREPADISDEQRDMLAMRREEAIHDLFRRLFLLTTEQYLKGELDSTPALGAWRRHRRPGASDGVERH